MSSRTLVVSVLAALLGASVGLNVYLALQGEAPRARASAPNAPPAPPPPADVSACHAELDRCHKENWGLALRTMAGPPAAAPATAAEAAPVAGATADAGIGRSGPAEQDEALTLMAREQVRLQWRLGREALVPLLVADLRDPSKQESWTRLEVDAMVKSANMSEAQKARLDHEYGPLRAERAAAVRDAMSERPPDIASAVAATKGLYADEDALMQRVSGDVGRERWRSETMHVRTAMLAAFAAFGDQPWDKSLAW